MRRPAFFACILMLLGGVFFFRGGPLLAQSPEVLRGRIEERNKQIEALEAEIAAFEQQLSVLGKEKQSLQNTIKTLDLTRKKIIKDIALTQSRIAAKDLEIAELSGNIRTTGTTIDIQRHGVEASLRALNELDQEPLAAAVLGEASLSSFFDDIVNTLTLKGELEEHIHELRKLKTDLETSKSVAETKRAELAFLRKDLAGQQKTLDANRAEQARLLKETQNKEANYQTLLRTKQEAREAFERDLRSLEEQLRITVDPSSLPRQGRGVLAWPLDAVRITQYFGNTPFATANPQIYSNKGHNGVDLAASVGTRIKASRSGVVKGTGNTDLIRGCYSYGMWVLVEHDNGLSTLYAHLSYISVTAGQNVSTGSIVGYSGTTGYSTGPHLHFAVFATQGTRIMRLSEFRGGILTPCANATIPVADPKAYLNPLSYL